MPGFFVTATGTDVGKTFVTAGMIEAGRRAGLAMDAFKPVLSGYSDADAAASDAGRLLAALGRPVTTATIADIAPWRFAAPLSPDMAAALEGRALDPDAIVAACLGRLGPDHLTLVEGVGGLMVPIEGTFTILDLIVRLGLPIVLVTAAGLGTISHTLTTLAALAQRGLRPHAIVLNEGAVHTAVPLSATRATLQRFCGDIPLEVVSRHADAAAFDLLLARVRP
jgi:dethiobiotin synthetase